MYIFNLNYPCVSAATLCEFNLNFCVLKLSFCVNSFHIILVLKLPWYANWCGIHTIFSLPHCVNSSWLIVCITPNCYLNLKVHSHKTFLFPSERHVNIFWVCFTAHTQSVREGNVFSLSVHRVVYPLLPMTSGGCSGTTGVMPSYYQWHLVDVLELQRGMPPTTNNTWWMDLELQGVCPPTTNDTWWIVSALQQISWILFHKTASFVLFENYGRQNWYLWILCI